MARISRNALKVSLLAVSMALVVYACGGGGPPTGQKVADEGAVHVAQGSKIDSKRYSPAFGAHLSPTRTTRDAEILFERAYRNAERKPERVVTDGLRAYQDGIEKTFGGDTRHEVAAGIRYKSNNNLMERVNGTIRQRTKVMRGLKSRETANELLHGWTLHYNYFKPHEGLNGRTPATAAGIQSPFTDWEQIARLDVRPYSLIRARRELEQRALRRRQELPKVRITDGTRRRSPFPRRRGL